MRWILRLVAGVGLLLVLALAAVALFLPTLAKSPALRNQIERAAHEATGRNFSYANLNVGVFPPRLMIDSPRLAGATPEAPPLLRAETINLKLALLPLLARIVFIDELVIEQPEIQLRRTPEGFLFPVAEPAPADAPGGKKKASAEVSESGGGPVLGVRSLRVRGGRLAILDTTQIPAAHFEMANLQLRAAGTALDEPIDVKLSGDFVQGGTIDLRGSVGLDGKLDLTAALSELALASVAPLIGSGIALGGTLSGEVHLRGSVTETISLSAELTSRDLAFKQEGLRFSGPLRLSADLAGKPAALQGGFQIDATDGVIEYGDGIFVKPAGKPASVEGKLLPTATGGFEFDEVKLQIHTAKARARAHGTPMQIELDAPAFALAGWETLVPGLGVEALSGQLALDGLSVRLSPLDLRGRLKFLKAGMRLPKSGETVVLNGDVEARGTELSTKQFSIDVAEQPISIEGSLSGIGEAHPHYTLTVHTEEAALARLLAAAGVEDEPATGPLRLTGVVSGELTDADSFLDALRGSLSFDVGRGRLRGVSLLRSTFESLGDFGEAALALGNQKGGKTLQRFYEDEFEQIAGTVAVRDGFARSEDLRLRYKSYEVNLKGKLKLADQTLVASGFLKLLPEVDQALAERTGGKSEPEKPRVIPLASVTGTLRKPRVDLRREAVLALVGDTEVGEKVEKIERKIDEKYGEGTGRAVRGILDSILGGGQ